MAMANRKKGAWGCLAFYGRTTSALSWAHAHEWFTINNFETRHELYMYRNDKHVTSISARSTSLSAFLLTTFSFLTVAKRAVGKINVNLNSIWGVISNFCLPGTQRKKKKILFDDLNDIFVAQDMFLADLLRIVLHRRTPYVCTSTVLSECNPRYIGAPSYHLNCSKIALWMWLQKSSTVHFSEVSTTGAS